MIESGGATWTQLTAINRRSPSLYQFATKPRSQAHVKVLLVDPANFTPSYNGALATSLQRAGAVVEVVTSLRTLPVSADCYSGLPVRHLFPGTPRAFAGARLRASRRLVKGLSYPIGVARLAAAISSIRPDVVHFQWSLVPPVDLLLLRYLRSRRIATVLTVHNVEPAWPIPGQSVMRSVFKTVGQIVIHSTAPAAQFARSHDLAAGSIRVIPHGTFIPARQITAADRVKARRNLKVPDAARVVLFFGELKPYKGLPSLVDALVSVRERIPGLFFLLAGSPDTDADIPTLSPLNAAGVPYEANFAYIPENEVWQYFAAADVVALPYRRISQSGVVFTALGYGRAVVCTPVGGLPEVLASTNGGWVAKSHSVADFADSLVEALTDVVATGERGAAAGGMARTLYAWDVVAEQTLQMYRELLYPAQKGGLTVGSARSPHVSQRGLAP